VTITPKEDALVEGSETVILTLSSNASYTIGSPSNATVTIADNDVLPTVTIVATDANAAEEGLDTGVFTISRTGSTAASLNVYYTRSGTAVNGTDFNTITSPATIPAGSSSATVTITPKEDALVEGSETVILTLSSNASYTIGSPGSATVTISDNDTICTGTITVGTDYACASGEQVEIPIDINNTAGRTDMSFSISFDKTKLQYTGKTSGDMGAEVLTASKDNINRDGKVQPIVTFSEGGPTSGTIVKFEFILLSVISEGSENALTIGDIIPEDTYCGESGAVKCGGECLTWEDVIQKYVCYVNGQCSWQEVIDCYSQYVNSSSL
jgi:hypothetical protein